LSRVSRWFGDGLADRNPGRRFGAVILGCCGLGGADYRLRGSSAERVAEAKEDRTKQGEGEEDAKDGCGSEGSRGPVRRFREDGADRVLFRIGCSRLLDLLLQSCIRSECLIEQVYELHGEGKYDGGIFLDTYFGEGLEVTQL
jgi:hypothetical protein